MVRDVITSIHGQSALMVALVLSVLKMFDCTVSILVNII